MNRLIITCISLLFVCVLSSNSSAALVTDGGFDNSFTGWTTSLTGGSSFTEIKAYIDPNINYDVNYYGLLTGYSDYHQVKFIPPIAYMLYPGGASISQSISANAGDTLQFQYAGKLTYGEAGQTPTIGFELSKTGLDQIIYLADTNYQTPQPWDTVNWYTYSYTIPQVGNYTIKFFAKVDGYTDPGVLNEAQLAIDNVELIPVPEPRCFLLLIAGLMTGAYCHLRRFEHVRT